MGDDKAMEFDFTGSILAVSLFRVGLSVAPDLEVAVFLMDFPVHLQLVVVPDFDTSVSRNDSKREPRAQLVIAVQPHIVCVVSLNE